MLMCTTLPCIALYGLVYTLSDSAPSWFISIVRHSTCADPGARENGVSDPQCVIFESYVAVSWTSRSHA